MIFVDTGAIVGRYLPDDQHHAAARVGWQKIREKQLACCTSNLVVVEAITLLTRRAGGAFAAETGRLLYSSQALRILRTSPDDEIAALAWLHKFSDQSLSFTDGVSFVLMRRHGLRHAFTFDRHFVLAGFSREF